LRHRFELSIRFRTNQVLESLDEFRSIQSQIVQGFDEWHHDNFVPMPAFANANRVQTKAAPNIPDAALANLIVDL
jgi:hypothetical protein